MIGQEASFTGWKLDFIIPTNRWLMTFSPPPYDEGLDDVRSLLRDLCAAFARENAQFVLSSPEAGAWPVDVAEDLPVIIEQVPKLLHFLQDPASDAFELDVYTQGIALRIDLRKAAETIEAVCLPFGEGHRVERSISTVTAWQEMVLVFWDKFYRATEERAPLTVQHPWWKQWTFG